MPTRQDEVTLHKKLKDMKLHEDVRLGGGIIIQKVIGGWIYWRHHDDAVAGVFVPEP